MGRSHGVLGLDVAHIASNLSPQATTCRHSPDETVVETERTAPRAKRPMVAKANFVFDLESRRCKRSRRSKSREISFIARNVSTMILGLNRLQIRLDDSCRHFSSWPFRRAASWNRRRDPWILAYLLDARRFAAGVTGAADEMHALLTLQVRFEGPGSRPPPSNPRTPVRLIRRASPQRLQPSRPAADRSRGQG